MDKKRSRLNLTAKIAGISVIRFIYLSLFGTYIKEFSFLAFPKKNRKTLILQQ